MDYKQKYKLLLFILILYQVISQDNDCIQNIQQQLKYQNVNATLNQGQLCIKEVQVKPFTIVAENCTFKFQGSANSILILNQKQIQQLIFKNVYFEKGINEGLVLSSNELRIDELVIEKFDTFNENGFSMIIQSQNIQISQFNYKNDVEFTTSKDRFNIQLDIQVSGLLRITELFINIQSWQKYSINVKAARAKVAYLQVISNIATIATDSFTQNQDISFIVEDSFEIDQFQQIILGKDQKFVSCDSILNISSNTFSANQMLFSNSSLWVGYSLITANNVSIKNVIFKDIQISKNKFIIEDISKNECQNQILHIVSTQGINIDQIEIKNTLVFQNRYLKARSPNIQIQSISFPPYRKKQKNKLIDYYLNDIYGSGFIFYQEEDGEEQQSFLQISQISLFNVNIGSGENGIFIIKNFKTVELSKIKIIQNQLPKITNRYPQVVKNGGYFSIQNCQNISITNSNIQFDQYPYFISSFGGIFALSNCSNTNINNLIYSGGEQYVFSIDSSFNQYGGFLYSSHSSKISLNNINVSKTIIQGDGGFGYIDGDIIIDNSTFIDCYAYGSGGTLFIRDSQQVTINNVIIKHSKSGLFGGGIFLQDYLTQITFNNLSIQQSIAQVGGGIMGRIEDFSNIQFKENFAYLYGNDHSNLLEEIKVISFGEYNKEVGYEFYKKEKSFSQKVINDQIYLEVDDLHNLQSYYIELDLIIEGKVVSSKKGNLNKLTQFMQSDDNLILLNEDTLGGETIHFYFIFQINNQNKSNLQSLVQFYSFKLMVNGFITNDCFSGQISKTTTQTCEYCKNQYFKPISSQQNNNSCTYCSQEIYERCYADVSILKKGFYRESQISNIYSCSINSLNCKGGYGVGQDLCEQGRTGEECLECNLKNQVNGENYSRSSFLECTNCSEIKFNKVLIAIVGFLIILISCLLFFVIQSQQRAILIRKYINATQIAYFGTSYEQCNYAGTYFKILSFYLQIVTICSYQTGTPIFKNIILFQVNLYNPLSPAFISVDCFLQQMLPDFFSVPYLRIIISAAIPLVLAMAFSLYIFFRFLFGFNKENTSKEQLSNIQDNTEARYSQVQDNLEIILLQPQKKYLKIFKNRNTLFQVISFLLFSISAIPVSDMLISGCLCRQFQSGNSYSIIDFTLSCNDETRKQYVYLIVVPLLAFFSIIFPLIIFYLLFMNRKQLDNQKVQFQIGYLYKEYKRKYYYWEYIRYLFRLVIIFVVYYFYENFTNMGIVSIAVLIFYSILLTLFRPFAKIQNNYLEITLVTSSIIMILVYLKKQQVQQESSNLSLTIFIYIANIQALLFVTIIMLLFLKYSLTHLLVKLRIYPFKKYSQRVQNNIKKLRIVSKMLIKQKSLNTIQNSTSSLVFQSMQPLELQSSNDNRSNNVDQFISLNQQNW